MDLSKIKPAKGAVKSSKRIGRGQGSGKGGTSTKGHKGQQSRSGYSRKRGFEGGQMPLQRRMPKRGFAAVTIEPAAEVRLGDLRKVEGDTVDLVSLKAAGILAGPVKRAKIILSGKVEKAFKVQGIGVTKGAKAAIEAAGGSIAA